MKKLFEKNLSIITEQEQMLLSQKQVLVAGCGGLGGSVIEILCRLGFSRITAVDADVFEPTNMNRQILCTADTLGTKKAEAAARRAKKINPEIRIESVCTFLDDTNAAELIRGKDLVIDALDSVKTRLILEDACEKEKIPLIHGAVRGWMIQTAVCPPGSRILHRLYGEANEPSKSAGGTALNVFSCASFEVTEAVKLLLGKEEVLEGKVLFFDLLTKESQIVEL